MLGDIEEVNSNHITHNYKWKKRFYKGLTFASVLINPLFAIFLYIAISSAIKKSRSQLNLESKIWDVFFIVLNFTISFLSGISDIVVVNPTEEAEELLKSLGDNQLNERLENLTVFERRVIKGFNYFNQIIGNSVFLVGSASAALSLTLFSSSIFRWVCGVPITILSHVYLNILSRAKIDEHSYQFLHILLDRNKFMIINAFKSPLRSFEVLIQVLVNALNRGITYGYIMEQILKEYFNDNSINNKSVVILISYAATSSFYTFLFSRTLNVHKQFFNPQFEELSAELLKDTKVSYLGILVDIGMTTLRAGAASILLFRHGPNNVSLNIVLAGSLGLFITSHGLYVRYKNRFYRTALDTRLTQIVKNIRIDDHKASREELSSEKMFDLIKEQFKIRTSIKVSATIINCGSRLADWFSFFGFLITMNNLIETNNNINFDYYDLLCIQQLLCNPALENSLSFFQESIVDTLAYYRTKFHLEWNDKHFGCRSLFKAKTDYPRAYLKNFLTVENDREASIAIPNQHSSIEMQIFEEDKADKLKEQQNLSFGGVNENVSTSSTTLFELRKEKDEIMAKLISRTEKLSLHSAKEEENDSLQPSSINSIFKKLTI